MTKVINTKGVAAKMVPCTERKMQLNLFFTISCRKLISFSLHYDFEILENCTCCCITQNDKAAQLLIKQLYIFHEKQALNSIAKNVQSIFSYFNDYDFQSKPKKLNMLVLPKLLQYILLCIISYVVLAVPLVPVLALLFLSFEVGT